MFSVDVTRKSVPSLSPTKRERSGSKRRASLPELMVMYDDEKPSEQANFTFPQLSPSMILQETLHSLDSKVPLIPGLDDIMMLCTTKIGTKRFQTPVDAEFDLRSPHSPSLEYNYLHDPHLRKYFQKASVRDSLTKQGLITEDGFVKCSTREFNEYRQWIRRLKLNKVESEVKEQYEKETNEESNSPRTQLTDHAIEVLEACKQKQAQAKRSYREKVKKDKEDRRRLMKNLEQAFKSKAHLRDEHQVLKKMKCKQREKEEELRRAEHKKDEEIQRSERIRALSEKDEIYTRRRKEIEESRGAQRKSREQKAIEKWKRRQSYCLKMMEKNKLSVEKGTQERKDSMMKRNEAFNRERQKREDEFEKSMQLSREIAYENLQKANRFLQRAEKRKEAEIKRWREKNLIRVSPSPRPKKPAAIVKDSGKQSKSQWFTNVQQKHDKKSMWKIDSCLNERRDSKSKMSSTIEHDNDILPDSNSTLPTKLMKDEDDDTLGESLNNEERGAAGEEDCLLHHSYTDDSVEDAELNFKNSMAGVQNSSFDSIEIVTVSRQLAEEVVLAAADQMQMNLNIVKEAIAESEAEVAASETIIEDISGSFGCCFEASSQSINEDNLTSFNLLKNGPKDASSKSSIDQETLSASDSVQKVDSAAIITTAKKVIESIISGALKRLGLTDVEYARLMAEIKRQGDSIETLVSRDSHTDDETNIRTSGNDMSNLNEHSRASMNATNSRGNLNAKASVGIEDNPVLQDDQAILSEAKRLAEDALKEALKTVGNSDSTLSCPASIHSVKSSVTYADSASLLDKKASKYDPVIMNESVNEMPSKDTRELSTDSVNIISKLHESKVSDMSITAKKIAYKAVETALNSLEQVEFNPVDAFDTRAKDLGHNVSLTRIARGEPTVKTEIDGPVDITGGKVVNTNEKKRPSILLNVDEDLRMQANAVVKDAIKSAAKAIGCKSKEMVKVEEYLEITHRREEKPLVKVKSVRFDDSYEEQFNRTPSKSSNALSIRKPTPHASLTSLRTSQSEASVLQEKDIDDLVFQETDAEVLSECPSIRKKLEMTDSKIEQESIKEVKQESEDSIVSGDSIEKRIAASKTGRRPTPFFGKAEKKRLFDQMANGKKIMEMDTFGEYDELEESETVDDSEATNELQDICESRSDLPSFHCKMQLSNTLMKGSAPEIGKVNSFEGCVVRNTFSSIVPNTSAESKLGEEEAARRDGKDPQTQDKSDVIGHSNKLKEEQLEIRENEGSSDSNLRLKSKGSIKKRSSTALQINRQQSSSRIQDGVLKKTISKSSTISKSKIDMRKSSSRMNERKTSIDMKGSTAQISPLAKDSRIGHGVTIERKASSSMSVKRSSKDMTSQRLSDQSVTSKKSEVSVAQSDRSVTSKSSHFLPHVRPSRSRMTCRIDESVLSCTREEMQSAESINSQDIMSDEQQEVEKVMNIEEIEQDEDEVNDKIEKVPEEMLVNSTNAAKVSAKLNDYLAVEEHKKRRAVSEGDLKADEHSGLKGERVRSENGAVTGFKYSEYIEMQTGKGESKETLFRDGNGEVTDKIDTGNLEHRDSLNKGIDDELLQGFVVIDEEEMGDIKHVNAGVLSNGGEEGYPKVKEAVGESPKEAIVKNSVNELEVLNKDGDTVAINYSDALNVNAREETNKEELADSGTLGNSVEENTEEVGSKKDSKTGSETEVSTLTRNQRNEPGNSQSMVLNIQKRPSNSKITSRSDIIRRSSQSNLSRTSSSTSGINFERRRSKRHRVSIGEPNFDFPKESGDKRVEKTSSNSVHLAAEGQLKSTEVDDLPHGRVTLKEGRRSSNYNQSKEKLTKSSKSSLFNVAS